MMVKPLVVGLMKQVRRGGEQCLCRKLDDEAESTRGRKQESQREGTPLSACSLVRWRVASLGVTGLRLVLHAWYPMTLVLSCSDIVTTNLVNDWEDPEIYK